MAADFKAIGQYDTVIAKKASETVIEAGDLVAIDTGLIIKAVAGSTAIAFAPAGAAAGATEIEVTNGRVELIGTADANFAVANKGAEVDLAGTTTLLIDLGESTTDVFKVSMKQDAGTVGSTLNVKVEINKPINF